MNKMLTASLVAIISGGAFAVPNNPNADWMAGRRGVFAHYIPSAETFADCEKFDVERLVGQLVEAHVDWFGMTFGQNSGFYCAPNSVVDRRCGVEPGVKCSKRDIIGEVADALAEKGIRFTVYIPGQPCNRDDAMERAFGFMGDNPNGGDRMITKEAAINWAEAIEEWAVRYGEKVSAWWFDGTYPWVGFTNEIGEIYAAACKKGNPNAVVTFNQAVADWRFRPIKPYVESDDYLAGESDHPLDDITLTGPRLDGYQWNMLTFLGTDWGVKNCRYPDCVWEEIIRRIIPKGGALMIDVNIDSTGLLCPEQMAQIGRIFSDADDKAR